MEPIASSEDGSATVLPETTIPVENTQNTAVAESQGRNAQTNTPAIHNTTSSNPKMYVRSHSAGAPVTHHPAFHADPNSYYYENSPYMIYPPPSPQYHGAHLPYNVPQQQQQQQPYSAVPMRRRPSPTYVRHNPMYYQSTNANFGPTYPPPNGYAPSAANKKYNHDSNNNNHSSRNLPVPQNVDGNSTSIDSALLSALLNDDMEECWALLRLEQVLMEFVQNTTTGWLEVGGPYNSVVIYASSSSDPDADLNNARTTNPVETEAALGSAMANLRLSQPPPQYPYQQQTTFQRCILHRLADRFNIIREPGRSSCHTSNMLRLIKMPNTCIPKMSLAEYFHKYIAPSHSDENAGMPDPTEGDAEALEPAAPQPMKIMKRASSQKVSAEDGLKKSASSTSSTLDSNLEDKERAYAEARARIFQDSEATENTAELEPDAAPQSDLDHSARSGEDTAVFDPQSKAVYRNRYQEVADPDFQRYQSRRSLPAHPYLSLEAPYAPDFVWPAPPPPAPPERAASAKLKAAAPEFVPRWQQPS